MWCLSPPAQTNAVPSDDVPGVDQEQDEQPVGISLSVRFDKADEFAGETIVALHSDRRGPWNCDWSAVETSSVAFTLPRARLRNPFPVGLAVVRFEKLAEISPAEIAATVVEAASASIFGLFGPSAFLADATAASAVESFSFKPASPWRSGSDGSMLRSVPLLAEFFVLLQHGEIGFRSRQCLRCRHQIAGLAVSAERRRGDVALDPQSLERAARLFHFFNRNSSICGSNQRAVWSPEAAFMAIEASIVEARNAFAINAAWFDRPFYI